jgi:hypothetical protein
MKKLATLVFILALGCSSAFAAQNGSCKGSIGAAMGQTDKDLLTNISGSSIDVKADLEALGIETTDI